MSNNKPVKIDNSRQRKQDALKALERSLGVVSMACKEIGVHRSVFYYWMNNDPVFRESVESAQYEELAIDFVEASLYKLIKEGNAAATIFYLKTKGKKRGYTEKQQIDLNIKRFVLDEEDDDEVDFEEID